MQVLKIKSKQVPILKFQAHVKTQKFYAKRNDADAKSQNTSTWTRQVDENGPQIIKHSLRTP